MDWAGGEGGGGGRDRGGRETLLLYTSPKDKIQPIMTNFGDEMLILVAFFFFGLFFFHRKR